VRVDAAASFLFDVTGRTYPPPSSYPHFFYGFLSVALAWQFAFFRLPLTRRGSA
jgi:hypothetical protein